LVKTMPRYFFNLTNGDSVADEVGEEFDRVEAARGHAMEVARELSRHRLPDALIGRHISVVSGSIAHPWISPISGQRSKKSWA
jgi:hypothetical protein